MQKLEENKHYKIVKQNKQRKRNRGRKRTNERIQGTKAIGRQNEKQNPENKRGIPKRRWGNKRRRKISK